MLNSIAYFVIGIFAIAVLTGIIIIIRNQITITSAYNLLKKKLKAKQRKQHTHINPVKIIELQPDTVL